MLPSEVVPNERRIKVVAHDVEMLREQVLRKLKLPVETGLGQYEIHEVRGQEILPVHALDQLKDKSKLQVVRRLTDDVEDRRARMKSAFSLISEGAGVPGVSTPTDESSGADGEDGEEVPGTTFIRYHSVDGVPYYYDRVTGETQWNEPQVRSEPRADRACVRSGSICSSVAVALSGQPGPLAGPRSRAGGRRGFGHF